MTDIAATLRSVRLEAGVSQVELAARAGTSQPALARYETGAALPTLPTLERLLAACGRRLCIEAPPVEEDIPRATSSVRGQIGPLATALRHNRRRLLDAAEKNGVRGVRVFGSVARGEDRPDSDVDLLVDLKPERTLLDLAAFRRAAAEILGAEVDVATVDMLKSRARAEALAESLPL